MYFFYDPTKAVEYVSAYATEKMLSVDNLFVMLLIFNYFSIEEKYQHRVLIYGILGAIILRAIFIGLGAVIISHFHWVLYIFGAILVYTGIKLFFEKKEEHVDFSHNKAYKLAHKFLRFTQSHHGGKFFVRENGKLFATTLFLVMILIEWTDLVFAIDSLPAAFSISQDHMVVYTSNIFAILGLRAMFFLLEAVIHKFHHLQKGLSLVLIAIGGKMLLDIVDIHISSGVSFAIVLTCLVGSLVLSVLFPKKF
jgi:tellurite resistance protein TerC